MRLTPGNGPVTPHAARRSFCDSRDWRRQLDAFAAEFSVIVPTLLLYGDADVRAPTAVADALHAQIPGWLPVRLAGVGHCGHVQAPEQWNPRRPRLPARDHDSVHCPVAA
jgi:pimeloyl-ACP methyl ester carboxylesterase